VFLTKLFAKNIGTRQDCMRKWRYCSGESCCFSPV